MFSKRLFGLILLGMMGFFVGKVSAETAACTVASTHATFADALNDPACTEIHLPSGSYAITATIDRDVSISGAGDSTQIAPPFQARVFVISADVNVSLSHMRLGGNGEVTDNGGVIYNDGSLTISDATINNGSAQHSGGGIYSTGHLTLTSVTMTGNIAQYGGAVATALDSTLTIDDSDISVNFATNGGGIRSHGDLTITNSTFDGSSASDGSGGNVDAQGLNNFVTITDSTFRAGFANSHGGGVYVTTDALIERTLFTNNFANRGGGLSVNGGRVTLRDNEWRGNSAFLEGGGLSLSSIDDVLLENGIVRENSAEINGGGILATGLVAGESVNSSVQIINSQIISNSVSTYDFETGGAGLSLGKNVTLTQSTIRFNSGTDGGGIRVTGENVYLADNDIAYNTATARGGGIFVKTLGQLTVEAVSITHNRAESNGGGVYAIGTLIQTQTTVQQNSAGGRGGGMAVGSSGVISAERSTIAHNDATDGGGLAFMHSAQGTFKNVTVSSNSAANNGGALHADLQSVVDFTHATIVNNGTMKPIGSGGGLYVASDVTVRNSIIAGNHIAQDLQQAHVDCHEAGSGSISSHGGNISGQTNAACATHTKDQQVLATVVLGGVLSADLVSDNDMPATHALLANSAAIDTIFPNLNGCGTEIVHDQRLAMRPVNAMCDSGAYELQSEVPTAVGMISADVGAPSWSTLVGIFALLAFLTLNVSRAGLVTRRFRHAF